MGFYWKGYRIAAWLGLAVLVIMALVVLIQGDLLGAATLVVYLAAGIIFLRLEDALPPLFDFLFVIAGLANSVGFVWNFFSMPGPYDEIVHGYTTFSITLALGFLVYGFRLIGFRGQHVLIVLTIASFGTAIGAVWEIAEWAADQVLAAQVIESLDDTITDLIMDSLGAFAAAITSLVVIHQEAQKRHPQQAAVQSDMAAS